MKDWFFDESVQVGVDYSQKEKAEIYDDEMEGFRDYESEAQGFVDKLGISDTEQLTAVDIGCGTGAFSIHASRFFKKVYAVDVSDEMLNIAKLKAKMGMVDTVEFCKSGFLRFQPEKKVDVVFTKWAFHHLPDFWKQAALLNMNSMLKLGGKLFISDFIFKFDPEFVNNTESLLSDLSKDFNQDFVDEVKVHIKDEYSTFDWILQGLIERAGFEIEAVNTEDCLASEYLCKKVKSFSA